MSPVEPTHSDAPSRFFREREAFDALAAWGAAVVAARDAAGDARPLDLLCAPCGMGEDAYGMVLALVAAGIPASRVRVDAYDRDESNVHHARAAAYDAGPVLDDATRAAVRVRVGELLHPSIAAVEARYDAIFCRDRLYALDATTQERTLALLDRMLAPQGLLFVGTLDRFAVKRAGLRLAGFPTAHAYCATRMTGPVPGAPVIPVGRRMTPLGQAALKARPTPSRVPWERPIAPPVQAPVVSEHAATAESELARAERLADTGQLREAASACEAHLRAQPSSVPALALLALLCDALGELERATACYRAVLELEPRHADALMHLALVGERAAANR